METSVPNDLVRPRALTIDDFVKAYRISRTSTYKLLGEGKLRSVLVGGRRLIPVDSAEELLRGEIRTPDVQVATRSGTS